MRAYLLTFLLIPMSLMAQIETDRPDFTESPNVVPKGAVQVETGFMWERSTEDHCLAEYYTNTTLNTSLWRYGLTDKTELRFNWSIDQERVEAKLENIPVVPCTSADGTYGSDTSFTNMGLSPVFFGIKHNIVSNDRVAIGFLAHIYLPYASEAFDVDRFAPEFLLPISVGVTDRFSVSMQPGMSWDGTSVEPTGWVTLSLAYSVNDALGVYLEPYTYLDEEKTDRRINGGVTYLFNDRFQWDASAGAWDASYANRHPNFFLSTGISYIWQ